MVVGLLTSPVRGRKRAVRSSSKIPVIIRNTKVLMPTDLQGNQEY